MVMSVYNGFATNLPAKAVGGKKLNNNRKQVRVELLVIEPENMEKIKGKARKKPVEIEFWVHDGTEENALEMMDWISDGNSVEFSCPDHEDNWDGTLVITTLEGDMRVDKGDYVIRGVKGEHYPCKPDIFKATYEVL